MNEEIVNLINSASGSYNDASTFCTIGVSLLVITVIGMIIFSIVNKKYQNNFFENYLKKKEEYEEDSRKMDIYENELNEESLNLEKEKLKTKEDELKNLEEKFWNRESLITGLCTLCVSIGMLLIFISAYKHSYETKYLREANTLLKKETKIVAHENDYVIKAYYMVDRKENYELKLYLRILNLTSEDITNATLVEKNSGMKYENVSVPAFEYVEIEFLKSADYTNELDFEIIK